MRQVIYRKQYGPVERIAEISKESGPTISAWGKEVLISAAIEFSKRYQQGIEISEDGNELGWTFILQTIFLWAKERSN